VVLGYVGWQYYGTNVVSHHRQAAIVDQVERAWREHPAGATAPPTVATVEVDEGNAEALMRIPRFGDDYVMPVLAGTSDDVLAAGLGHFAGTAGPGEVGNFALAGHRVTHGEPLRDLPELVVGDHVVVETRDTTFTYSLVTGGDDLTVPFTASWVLDPVPTNPSDGGVEPPQADGEALLTLTTCSELFHTDDRLVAFAVLVDTQPRTG